jgi:hypothetical protein
VTAATGSNRASRESAGVTTAVTATWSAVWEYSGRSGEGEGRGECCEVARQADWEWSWVV